MQRVNGTAYPNDLRARVLAASDRGLSVRAVAGLFEVSASYVVKARQRRDRTGVVCALKARQVQVRRLATHGQALREKVASRTDLTLAELCAWLRAERAASVGTTAL